MNKNDFESFEYLHSNNADAESDQFFIIQEDGTFLLNRQVQYVTEVQDVKEAIDNSQRCAVYGVSPQQFFVDVVNNPSELISVPDNYILPVPEGEDANNIYGNSFLFQTAGTEASEQPEKDLTLAVQFKEAEPQDDANVVDIVNKQGNTCTEITLTDEQYKTLEQKGWVLIESDGKIFILNSFGLHEVTTDSELIQSWKIESKLDVPTEVILSGPFKENEELSSVKTEKENTLVPNDQDTNSVVLQNEYKESETDSSNTLDLNKYRIKELELDLDNEEAKQESKEEIIHEEAKTLTEEPALELTDAPPPKKFKQNIPDKIVLGKTRNGKRLVARVVKRIAGGNRLERSDQPRPPAGTVPPAPPAPCDVTTTDGLSCIDDVQFYSMCGRAAAGGAAAGGVACGPRDVVHASAYVAQLLHVPEFGAAVRGRHLVVTTCSQKGTIGDSTRATSFVTGTVKSVEKGLVFIHVPHLLQKLSQEQEEFYSQSSRSVLKPTGKAPRTQLLQVHITETKHDGVDAISYLLKERLLPRKCDKTSPKKSLLHACSTCASIFQSEAELIKHQENHILDSEGVLTIDTDELPNDVTQNQTPNKCNIVDKEYYTVKTKKGSHYCCYKCVKTFNKLSNCVRHIRSVHVNPSDRNPPAKKTDNEYSSTEDSNYCEDTNKYQHSNQYLIEKNSNQYIIENRDKEKEAPYKCKMCSSAYFYPSSLSKHINKTHIKEKINNIIVFKQKI